MVISDLRMGVDPEYLFACRVAEIGNPHLSPIFPERVSTERDFGRLRGLRERM